MFAGAGWECRAA